MSVRLAGLITLAAMVLTVPSLAQESARDFVEPRINRSQFTIFYRQLGLDSDQRSIVELMFADYTTTLDALTRELDKDAQAAGLRQVQDALAGKARLAPEELRDKRVAVLRVFQRAWPEVDKAMDDLVHGVESLLTADQRPRFDPALRELRRSALLHPRQASSDFQEYAGDGVDVLLLVEDASKPGAELHVLDPAALNGVLAQYEQQVDNLLVRTAQDYRNSKLLRRVATIEKDNAALRELDRAAIARWKELYQLNQTTVQTIGRIAEANLGEQAKARWLDRFDHVSFGWLYPRRLPDRQIEWIRQQSLQTDAIEQAEGIYENYLVRRRELSRQAIDIMLRARLELQVMLYSMMDPTSIDDRAARELYQELLKNSGEQANLESSTSGMLESLLPTAQRDALRKAMQAPDRRR
jgi:hypothetical protein